MENKNVVSKAPIDRHRGLLVRQFVFGTLLSAFVGLVLTAPTAPAGETASVPAAEGSGEKLLEKHCQPCHLEEKLLRYRKTHEQWIQTISRCAPGLQDKSEEQNVLAAYLLKIKALKKGFVPDSAATDTPPEKPPATTVAPPPVKTPDKAPAAAVAPPPVKAPDTPPAAAVAPPPVKAPEKPPAATVVAPPPIKLPPDALPSAAVVPPPIKPPEAPPTAAVAPPPVKPPDTPPAAAVVPPPIKPPEAPPAAAVAPPPVKPPDTPPAAAVAPPPVKPPDTPPAAAVAPPPVKPPDTPPAAAVAKPPVKPSTVNVENLLAKQCLDCHVIEKIKRYRKTKEQWERTIDNMTKLGVEVTKEEQSELADYLLQIGPKIKAE